MKRFALWAVLTFTCFGLYNIYDYWYQPNTSLELSMDSMRGDHNRDTQGVQRVWRQQQHSVNLFLLGTWFLGTIVIFRKDIMKGYKIILGCAILAMISSTGCMKPYHEAMLCEIETSETAFLIELEGDNEQAGFDSEEFLESNMLATKRIEIPYEFKSTGRWPNSGVWIPSTKLVLVDREPENRIWVVDANKGTGESDQGIWVESKDSVGFSTGVVISARIENDKDAIKFLFNYPPRADKAFTTQGGTWNETVFKAQMSDLAYVLDNNVRNRVAKIFAREAAKYPMDECREKKNEIIQAIEEDVVPFFKERGITITTIGMTGGFKYENPQIQAAIDKVFEAQQDEEVAKAESKAAEQRREALRLIGEGEAQKALEKAKGEAEAIKKVADAKAYEVEQLRKDPEMYLKLKELEIQKVQADRWDGTLPKFQAGGSTPNFLMQIPEVK